MKQFIIDRDTWARGPRKNYRLKDDSGQCCLFGQILSQCGVPDALLLDYSYPDTLFVENPEYSYTRLGLPDIYHLDVITVMQINDMSGADEIRERKLTKEFARFGIEIVFVGGGDGV